MGNEATITIPLEKRNSVIGENKILKNNEKYNTAVIAELEEENKKLKEELSKKNMETWFDKKFGNSEFKNL